jgi:preprotein translocase subunit SecG
MFTLFIVLHVIFCVFLILVILLQTGKGAGIGAAFGGGSQTVFGPRGAGSFIGKVTGIVAGLFMLTSMVLAFQSTSRSGTVAERVSALHTESAKAVETVDLGESADTAKDTGTAQQAATTPDGGMAENENPGANAEEALPETADQEKPADATADKNVPVDLKEKDNEEPVGLKKDDAKSEKSIDSAKTKKSRKKSVEGDSTPKPEKVSEKALPTGGDAQEPASKKTAKPANKSSDSAAKAEPKAAASPKAAAPPKSDTVAPPAAN